MERIDKNNIDDILALTPMQEGMLFHYLKEPWRDAYFEQLSLSIKGDIHLDSFEQSWNFVIRTNEMLRTVFRWEKLENPVQITLKEFQLQPKYYDFSLKPAGEREKYLEEIKVKDRKEKFDLTEIPFRVTLCKVQETTYEMIISNHHILYDGWSNGIILKEFFNAYNDLVNGKALVKPGKGGFKEFVQWTKSQDREKKEKSWKGYLKGLGRGTELSIKKRNRKEITGTGRYQLLMEKDIRDQLEGFVKRYRRTLASIFYCAWGLLLQRYNSSEDVIFGTTISGRNANLPGIEDMVGLFINTLPLRIQISPHETINDLLYRLGYDLQTREEYESFSLVDIKQLSGLGANEEFFDSMVSLENYPLALILKNRLVQEGEQSLSVESYSMVEQTHYDLTVGITIFEDFEISLIYNRGVFERSGIINISRHFMNIIRGIIADPFGKVSDMDIITAKEKNKILYDFNNTGADFPNTKMLQQIFEEQVEKTPDNTALVGHLHLEGTRGLAPLLSVPLSLSISYLELNRQSERLAHMLREKCVQPDTIVGIMADSSMETIIAILAILKAGGVYLPVDPDYPQDRINYMLKDSGAKILLTGQEIAGLYSPPAFKIHPKGTAIHLHLQPAPVISLAYIIYTSGSTGRPKGVLVEHRCVVNILSVLQWYYPLMETDAYLLKTSYLFDVSVTELCGWFWAGGKLVLMGKGDRKDPRKILEAIKRHHITHINFVPSMFTAFLEILEQEKGQASDQLGSLKYIFLAGEALLPELVNRFQRLETGILLENLYGPTEGTIYASGYSLSQWTPAASIPIGKPLANVRLYIFNQYYGVQPVGVTGELCIAGEGIARGYLNRPELTAERFCLRRPGALFEKTAPVRETSAKNFLLKLKGTGKNHKNHMQSCNLAAMQFYPHHSHHSPIYRTGDLARWLADGNIEFLGRRDHQVKIRGFRVELGEIENLLLQHEAIRDAVVNAWSEGEDGDIYLCAYIVSDKQIKIPWVQEYLLKELPDYMVPAYFIRMERIPLTSSGKIDRKALPPPMINIGNDYAPPRNEIEIKLVKIWKEVLGSECSKIGINDNFFELGGHSLKAARVASRIHKELNIIVSLQEIMKYSSISKLAHCIRKAKKSEYTSPEWAEQKEYYLLSPAQKRLYILQQTEKENITYNMLRVLMLEGEPDIHRLETAMQRLIERHECLRTSFQIVKGEPVQFIHDKVKFAIEYLGAERKAQSEERKVECHAPCAVRCASTIKNFIRPFDLSQALLVRAGLIRLDDNQPILMVDMHHIISDGVSIGVLIKDFTAIYDGKELSPAKMHYTYKDFSEWQNSSRQKQKIKKQEQYWLKQFEDDIPVLNLPTDYTRPKVWSFAGQTIHFEPGKEETGALYAFAKNRDASLFAVLAAMFSILLGKLSGQEDIVMGTVSAGRTHAVLENIIGMFVNTLVLRSYPGGGKTINQFFNEFEKTAFDTFENQDYPFEELVDQVVKDRDASLNPLFDVMFVLQDLDIPSIETAGLKLTPLDYDMGISKFDLTFLAEKSGDDLLFTMEYSTKLFKESTMQRFIGYFQEVLAGALKDVGQQLSEIEIISEEEKKVLLYDFNDTKMDYPGDMTVHQLFEEQVERTPDHIALKGIINPKFEARNPKQIQVTEIQNSKHHFTYRELNEKTKTLARILREQGITADSVVGIMVPPGIYLMIGIMGILKAGGAYLPIDPNIPAGRVDYILEESNVRILLKTSSVGLKKSKSRINTPIVLDFEHLNFEICLKQLDFGFDPCPISDLRSSNLAYMIYTSGSTGRPKGTAVEHSQLVNFVCHMYDRYDGSVDSRDRCLSLTNIMFDVSLWELFLPLVFGAQLILLPEQERFDVFALTRAIIREEITLIYLPPGFLKDVKEQLIKQSSQVKLNKMLVGVEPIRDEVLEEYMHLNPDMKIINGYGPTETTICATSYNYPSHEPEGEIVPIGIPLSNNQVVLLDAADHIVPQGIAGEICISGDGVSRGYINNPELTAEKFTPHPYFKEKRMYRTGDLARLLPEGNIRFIGRRDHQVKIRGYRIELGEIESRLLKHKDVKQALVLEKIDEKVGKYLCAYIIVDIKLEISDLRKYLSADLPDYMIPSHFVRLERIPITPNGKVDRKALPEPEIKTGKNVVPPRDEIEKKLVEIWSEVLGRDILHASQLHESIGIDHHFFELGGHSLKAAIAISVIHNVFNVRITLAQLFTRPTIRALSQYIREAVTRRGLSIEPAEKKEYYPLSPAQKRMYILQKSEKNKMIYNIPQVMVLQGELEKERLEETFRRLIERHESFRISFEMVQGNPMQRVHHVVEFEIQYYDLATESIEKERVEDKEEPFDPKSQEIRAKNYIKKFIRPFDLSQPPLLRLGLVKTEHEQHLLMMDMHHIIFDGTSMKIFINELMALADGRELPPLQVHYKDFSLWQHSQHWREKVKNQEQYWLKRFKREIPILQLPYDYPRPTTWSYEGNTLEFRIDMKLTRALKQLVIQEEVTLFMALLAVYNILLSKLSWSEDIVVGTTTAGRDQVELQPIIGMFVNTLALRNYPTGTKTFKEFLKELKIQTLEAFENQDYPFENLVEKVAAKQDTSHRMLFDSLFTLQNIDIPEAEIPGLILKSYDYKHPVSRVDMTWMVEEKQENLWFTVEYSTRLFKKETIMQFADYFKTIIITVLEKRDSRLKDIEVSPGITDLEETMFEEEAAGDFGF